jgi:ubiquinone/menaquinone biosynthesis C-methylase UbiE
VSGHEVSAAPSEVWDRSLIVEKAEWKTLAWQRMPAAQRLSEWERHVRDLGLSLSDFANDHVLDVGCGPTGIVYFMPAARRVGLDPLGEFYEQWNGFYGEPIELVASQAESMPFNDQSFDTVFCINCLDHSRDANAVIREIARVIKPRGRLVVHVDLDSPLRKLHKRIKKTCRELHPLSLTYAWLQRELDPHFHIDREHRDAETFRANKANIRYEAFWDGLMYRLTRSGTWMHHIWLTAHRR